MKLVCLDSSAWIEIAHDGSNGPQFVKAFKDMNQVIVSTIPIYEVWKYTATYADETRPELIFGMLQQGIVSPPNPEISISAAKISMRQKTAMADSLIYATALFHKSTLWTQDADFDGLPHVKYFPKNNRS